MISYKNLFYFDIETAGQYPDLETFKDNDKRGYDLFMKRYERSFSKDEDSPEKVYIHYSPLFSTYGRILCLSFGYFHDKNEEGYTIKSLYNKDEKILMKEIQTLFLKVSSKHLFLSGYNINSFDIPWLQHKLLKYEYQLPPVLRTYGRKPWELQSADLFKEWNPAIKNLTVSFDEACYELGIPSPKEKIDGSKVHHTYWVEKDLDTVVEYCEGDVFSSLEFGKKMFEDNI